MSSASQEIDIFEKTMEEMFGDNYKLLEDLEKKDNFWKELPQEEKYKISYKIQKEKGIGKDLFTNNEPGSWGENLKGKTVLEWDMDNWRFQRKCAEEDGHPNRYSKEDYDFPIMQWEWVRWIENDKLIYGYLSSLEHHLLGEAGGWISDLQYDLIPHKHNMVPVKEDKHGKYYTMTIDAYGKEKEYETLSRRLITYEIDELINIIKDTVKNPPDMIWRKDEFDKEFDLNSHIIFSNKNVCGAVTFEDFLNDIGKFPGDDSVFEGYVEKLRGIVFDKVCEVYNEVIKGDT